MPFCSRCRSRLETLADIELHNDRVSRTGERAYGVASPALFILAGEIMYLNDEYFAGDVMLAQGPRRNSHISGYYVQVPLTPEERFSRMRAWVVKNLAPNSPAEEGP